MSVRSPGGNAIIKYLKHWERRGKKWFKWISGGDWNKKRENDKLLASPFQFCPAGLKIGRHGFGEFYLRLWLALSSLRTVSRFDYHLICLWQSTVSLWILKRRSWQDLNSISVRSWRQNFFKKNVKDCEYSYDGSNRLSIGNFWYCKSLRW